MDARENLSADAAVREKVGQAIGDRRNAIGLSQSQLGKLLRNGEGNPVPADQISKWERGVHLPGRPYWTQIADALRTSIDAVFGDLVPRGDEALTARLEKVEAELAALISALGVGDEVEAVLRMRRRLAVVSEPSEALGAQDAEEALQLAEVADLDDQEQEQGAGQSPERRSPTGT